MMGCLGENDLLEAWLYVAEDSVLTGGICLSRQIERLGFAYFGIGR